MRCTPIQIGLLLSVLIFEAPPAYCQNQPAARRQASFLNGPPFTFDQILEAIRRVRQGVLPDSRLRLAIQNRRLDFTLSPGDIDRLKAARPSQSLLDLIVGMAKPPEPVQPRIEPTAPPPPPPKPQVGTLQLACEPAECTVLVNGKPAGQSERGQLTVKDVAAGTASVNVQKEGYHVAELKAEISDGKITPVTATLEPMKETMRGFGRQLFEKMVAALGGADGLKYWSGLQGAGTVTLVNRQGQSSRWAFQTRLALPDLAALRLTTATKAFEATLVRSTFSFTKGMPEADEVEHMLALLRDFQLGAVVKRMQEVASSLEAGSLTPRAGQELAFLAENSVERWAVTLEPDSLPKQIKMESAAGVGTGVIVTYADFEKAGSTSIPHTMVLRLPDAPGHGMDVRFDRLESGPPFTEEDIRRKRKLFGR